MDTVMRMASAGSVRCLVQLAMSPRDKPRIKASAKMKFLFFKIFIINAIDSFNILILQNSFISCLW